MPAFGVLILSYMWYDNHTHSQTHTHTLTHPHTNLHTLKYAMLCHHDITPILLAIMHNDDKFCDDSDMKSW